MKVKRVKSKRFASGYGWQIDVRIKGQPRIRRTFETRSLAQDVEDSLRGDAVRRRYGLPVNSYVTLGELVERHLSAMRQRGRDKRSVKTAESILSRFRALVGGDHQIETIKTADLNNYVDLRYSAEKPPQPQTINRELTEIKSCLSAASIYFRTLEDYRSPKAPWQPEPVDGRRQTWSTEHVQAVLDELYAPSGEQEQQYESRVAVGDMFTIALQTGMRAGEVRKLKKSDLQLGQGVIIVHSKKGLSKHRSGKTREIPMTDGVYEILKLRAAESKSDWIFPNSVGDGPLSDHRAVFKAACARAGIPYGLNSDGALIFNDARRTAENIMLEGGHQARAVGDIMGHSAETMARHYARSTVESRRAAVEATKQNGRFDHS